jgi:hypothetical protein
MPATYRFGLKFLFDVYLTIADFLCDGHVIKYPECKFKLLIFNVFLYDGYVTATRFYLTAI